METTLTNQNYSHYEIKSKLNSENASYSSVQNLLTSRLLSENVKIKIYLTIVLPLIMYGYETLSLNIEEKIVN
jgi:hypothetical protein